MEENHRPYHWAIPENILTPLQHVIQHACHNGSFKNTNKIRVAMHFPQMDKHHTPRSNHPQSLAQTRNNHQSRIKHNAYA
jgi:hypothetical protein